MTKNEEKEIIRVCSENYNESDIPTYIRQRDKNNMLTNQELADKKTEMEEILEKKREELSMKKKWVKEIELEIEIIENRIIAIDNELLEKAEL